MISTAVQDKVFGVTAAFESRSGYTTVAGNGDGMLLRAGLLQWCLGMATLQPLLRQILDRAPQLFREHLGPARAQLLTDLATGRAAWRDAAAELTGAALGVRIRDVVPAWRAGVASIMGSECGVQVQREAMAPMLDQAWRWCQEYELLSERALCLFLDIRLQNGSIEPHCRSLILAGFERGMSDRERLETVAAERSNAVKGRLRASVLSRKMCIVHGKGEVDGRMYDLQTEFGLTDDPVLDN